MSARLAVLEVSEARLRKAQLDLRLDLELLGARLQALVAVDLLRGLEGASKLLDGCGGQPYGLLVRVCCAVHAAS